MAPTRRIARWKITGGAFLHFAPLAYLLAAGADALRLASANPQAGAVLTGVLRDSVPGLGIYAALGALATGAAFAVDAIAGLGAVEPPDALAAGRGRFGPEGDEALQELARLEPLDARSAQLVEHARALVGSSLVALESALPERRIAIVERAAAALGTLAEEASALRAEQGAASEAQAATLAGFVAAKYGRSTLERSSDSAGGAK